MIDLLRTRRSIRRYEHRPLEPRQVRLIEEALLRAPSSRSRMPWEHILVEDRELLERLALAKPHGSSFIKHAALAIVVCADEELCDVWVEDCSIAAILAQLEAHSLGLGSCWVQIRRRAHDDETTAEDYVREVLGIPTTLKVGFIIAIGHPADAKEPHPESSLRWSKLHHNRFGTPRR